MNNLSYLDLQTYIILSSIMFTLVILFSIRSNNKLVDRIEELEKELSENNSLRFIKTQVKMEVARKLYNEKVSK